MPQSEVSESWPIPPDDASTIGAHGRFRLAVKLGEGGMATVFRAWDTQEETWVAVKILLPEFARKRKLRARFEREATTMMQLEHRHIVKVLDVGGEAAGLPYIAMELADGGCVIDWVESHGPMPPRMAIDVIMQACKGLKAAHDMGIVHRDVKPHNILITRRGICRLTDFGIAQLEDAEGMTKTGSVMGTLGYMAPEQRTDSKNVDVRADIYGLGASLYKLVTGGTVADLFLAEHDTELMDGVPEPLVPVLLRATAYKPEARYGSVTELARALHEAKKKLDADPEGTPALPMELAPGYDPNLHTDRSESEDTFPDLPVGAFDPPAPPPGPPEQGAFDEEEVTDAQSLLPYTMPKQAAKVDDPDYVPDYIDRDALGSDEVYREDIDLDEQEKRKQKEAYQRAFDAGLIDQFGNPISEEEREAEQKKGGGLDVADTLNEVVYGATSELASLLMRPLQFAAIAMIIISVVMGIVVTTGASGVRAAREEALHARQTLYDTMDAEKSVITEIGELGGDQGMLETYWYDYQNPQDEVDRMEAAVRFIKRVQQTEQHVRQYGVDLRGGRMKLVKERVNRLNAALHDYDNHMTEWRTESDYARGKLAVGLGVAPGPDM